MNTSKIRRNLKKINILCQCQYTGGHMLSFANGSTGISKVKRTWDLLVQFLVSAHESMIISIKIETNKTRM